MLTLEELEEVGKPAKHVNLQLVLIRRRRLVETGRKV